MDKKEGPAQADPFQMFSQIGVRSTRDRLVALREPRQA